MTLSHRKFWLAAAFLLLSAPAFAADPPEAEMAAARSSLGGAARAEPRGPAADLLAGAQATFALAQDAMARRKYRDALRLAQRAQAHAELARALARRASAQAEFEEKSTRNAELRRQLLVLPEVGQ